MGPEAAAGIVVAIAAVLAATLGAGGLVPVLIAWIRRDGPAAPEPAVSPANEVRDAAPSLLALSRELARAGERVDALDARVEALEGSVWRCPVDGCPVREQLRREPTP